jgi:hypothetical protein
MPAMTENPLYRNEIARAPEGSPRNDKPFKALKIREHNAYLRKAYNDTFPQSLEERSNLVLRLYVKKIASLSLQAFIYEYRFFRKRREIFGFTKFLFRGGRLRLPPPFKITKDRRTTYPQRAAPM